VFQILLSGAELSVKDVLPFFFLNSKKKRKKYANNKQKNVEKDQLIVFTQTGPPSRHHLKDSANFHKA
jgi:hypothetical protein